MTDDVDANSTDMRGITDEVVATVQEARDVVPEAQQTRAEKVTMMKGAMAAIQEANATKGVIGVKLNGGGRTDSTRGEREVVLLRKAATIPGDRARELFGRAIPNSAEEVPVGIALSQEGYHLIPFPPQSPDAYRGSSSNQELWNSAILQGVMRGGTMKDSLGNSAFQGVAEGFVEGKKSGRGYYDKTSIGIPSESDMIKDFYFVEAGRAQADIIAEALQASIMEAQKSQVRQIESDTETADIGSAMITALRGDA